MNIIKELKTFETVSTETLIIGVQKHREQMKNWDAFAAFAGEAIDGWVRTGEISSDSKKITKLPYTGTNSNIKRIVFVGLGERKNLTEDGLREIFGQVGKQLKSLKVSDATIWLESFTAEDIDTDEDIEWLCGKLLRLRVFDDADGVMNLPVTDVVGADILVVSQFTLMASTRKGNRPSYIRASKPDFAVPMYEKFVSRLSLTFGHQVPTGTFGADMQVALVNDGPVTIIIDSHLKE